METIETILPYHVKTDLQVEFHSLRDVVKSTPDPVTASRYIEGFLAKHPQYKAQFCKTKDLYTLKNKY
jgi:hypothetical protein